MTALLAGFLLGLAGSAHCLGMCGPLALLARGPVGPARRAGADRAASGDRPAGWRPTAGLAFGAYHLVRLILYGAFGAVAGWAGGALAGAAWRSGLALTAGMVLGAQALLGIQGRFVGAGPARALRAITSRLASLSRRLPQRPIPRAAAFGVLNGLMPCGLLYGALAAAAGLGQASESAVFMAAFGLGSVPAFAALVYSARVLFPRAPARFRYAAPVALAVVGGLLIARGLSTREGHDHAGHRGQAQWTPHASHVQGID